MEGMFCILWNEYLLDVFCSVLCPALIAEVVRSRSARPAPAPRHAPARNPPQTVKQAPPPAPVQGGGGGILSGIGSTIVQGIGFGTGSAVAHRAVDAVMGPRTIQHETVVSEAAAGAPAPISSSMSGSDACSNHSKAFQDHVFRDMCVNHFGSDISKCQFYMDMLSECKKNSSSGMLSA
ncbi:Cox19-like CHCH family protein [Prunus dulcis]|uniref:Cox19-like CHCH family protein n=1 Tax=Prunus dulcis TaxID=3755 RepID=A0A5H2XJ63_PRUDU|nr:Cox19-like CHCH family protein [Prunus dulcis]